MRACVFQDLFHHLRKTASVVADDLAVFADLPGVAYHAVGQIFSRRTDDRERRAQFVRDASDESHLVTENTDRLDVRGGPAGGGYSTVEDLLKFHAALRSSRLLDPAHTALVTGGKVDAGALIGRYAYGFGDKVFDGKHVIGHNGGWPGVAANFEMYPELGYTSVVLMNANPPNMMPVAARIRQLILAK